MYEERPMNRRKMCRLLAASPAAQAITVVCTQNLIAATSEPFGQSFLKGGD